jgi:oleandomycin transport system permease protein
VLVFALCICWVSVLIGMLVREPGAVQGFGFLLMFPLTFGSTTFVPAATLPGWLQAWVHVNPVTHLVEATRGLMLGGPVAWPVVQSLLWSAGILAVFAPLAIRAYRRKT